ncbi:ATP-binding protein [Massilia pseudoviolaceinigra]|uniref:ATP-binding protein n=1 Tax=Massilia pseudoviolaceinigra TaxID=3057165 RepID=UPI00279673F4|nr:ATP-binding protein [Massilia sp. CCM 9206]MDQ1918949.1 ATP-binding protein [Massilia sp. CCM 9206]
MRALDWASTPVGPAGAWPAGLKTTVRLLLDCHLPMYLAWGPNFTQFYNDAYVSILGTKDEDALGGDARTTWAEIWPTIGPMWEQVLAGESMGSERFKLTIERYGYPEDCYFTFSYSPVPDEHGNPAGILVTFAETTREVLAEGRQAFQLRFADALRKLDDPAAITERAASMLGDYLGAGRAGYGEVDVSADTVSVRRDWTDGRMETLAGESRPLNSFGPDIIAELKAGRTLRLNEIGADPRSAPYAGGYASIGAISLLVVPLVKNGALAAILYLHCAQTHRWSDTDVQIAEDVAHRTWDAMERTYAETALVLADRRKDEFLAMLAHEMRNPLAPISSAAQLLEAGRLERHGVRDTARIILRQVGHITTLLNDLLDVSRVTRGIVELDLQQVDVRTVVDTAIEQLRPLIEARRHQLRFSAPSRPMPVQGDAVRLVQVVANVLNNSVKYSPKGASITLTLASEGDTVRLQVRDNGSGIAPELLPHVFDLFVQGKRTLGRVQGGLGLGLALVKSLVELHKGTVQAVSSGEECGTCVSIDLPRMPGVADDGARRPGEHGAAGEPARNGGHEAPGLPTALRPGLRILLVDDNVDAAAMVAILLELRGHTTTVVHSAQGALARAASLAPHVAILDIGLPDMDGYELIGKLKTDAGCRDTRFIALTGYGREQDRQRAFSAGFWRHMTKPTCVTALHPHLDEVAAAVERDCA